MEGIYIAIQLQFLGLFQALNFPCAKLSSYVENLLLLLMIQHM